MKPNLLNEPCAAEPSAAEPIDRAITGRRSIRAFLPTPVAPDVIREILDKAARAPSGTNMQPWRVYVVTGDAKARLTQQILAAHDDVARAAEHTPEYAYYPSTWASPYLERRRRTGWGLYGLLGIEKGDTARMHAQHARNFRFFDAPVGLIFTIDATLELGSWLDYGMFLQNIMILARARGLDTCPQAAFLAYHRIIKASLPIGAGERLVCGMSLGFADLSQPENTLVTEREPVESFVRFVDE